MMRRPFANLVLAAVLAACTPEDPRSPAPIVPPTSTAPAPTLAPSSSPSTVMPSPSPGPILPATAWDRAFTIDHGFIGSLVESADGLIALACYADDDGCIRRVLVRSSDGVTWDEEDLHSTRATLGESLYRADGRYFRIGYVDGRRFGGAIVWTSKDARTWTRVRSGSFRNRAIGGLVESPLGTFAFGRNALPGTDSSWGFIVWPVAVDGSFGSPRVVDIGTEDKFIGDMVWTGDEFLAWGGSRGGYWPQRRTRILASDDAMSGRFRGEIELAKAGYVSAVAPTGARLIAVGYEGRRFPLRPRAWTSTDAGRTWRPAEVPAIDARMSFLSAGERGLIAHGLEFARETETAIAWTTRTGRSWKQLPDDLYLPRVLGFTGLSPASIATRTCVAGSIAGEPIAAAIYCR